MEGLFERGKKRRYTARLQVPVQFQKIVGKSEIWQATGTSDHEEAMAFRIAWKRRKLAEWSALLAGAAAPNVKSRYEIAAELAHARGEIYRTAEDLAAGDLEEILGRVERLKASGDAPGSLASTALLGGIELPKMTLLQVANSMPKRFPEDYDGKTARGRSVWLKRWVRPAEKFIELVGRDPEFTSIERRSAVAFRDALRDRVMEGDYQAKSAMKELQNLSQLWKRHHEALGVYPEEVPPSPWRDLTSPLYKLVEGEGQKLEIPAEYLLKIIAPGALATTNPELRDIILVLIETGARQSEVTDIPPNSIHLQAPIPHLDIRKETGEFARNIKNKASKRKIPLVGVALEAMKRNPLGFPRYRGKGTFSAAANAYLHDRGLMPDEVTIGGSRHSFESRMGDAGYSNEVRGAMMGHSMKRIRGREVYGDPMTLQEKLEVHQAIELKPSFALPAPGASHGR